MATGLTSGEMESEIDVRGTEEPPLLEGTLAAMHEALALAPYRWVAPLVTGRRVLDAGCGIGRGAAILAEHGAAEVVAVDETATRIEVVKSGAPARVRPQRADLGRLPFAAATFDVAVSFSARESAGTHVLAELLRVVRRDGLLVLSAGADAERAREFLAGRRRYTAFVDQRELAGFDVDPEGAAGGSPEATVGPVPVLGDDRSLTAVLVMASDAAIPTLDPVAVTFDLGSVDQWLSYTSAQERRIVELETKIRELEEQLEDRNRLRRDLRVTEQALGRRIASYEEAVQSASLRAAVRYRNTVSWRVTYPLRKSNAAVKRLLRRLGR